MLHSNASPKSEVCLCEELEEDEFSEMQCGAVLQSAVDGDSHATSLMHADHIC